MQKRILSALIAAPLVLGVILLPGGSRPFPGWPLALLVMVLIIGGLREFYAGCRHIGLLPRDELGYGLGFYWLLCASPLMDTQSSRPWLLGLCAFVLIGLTLEVVRGEHAPFRGLGPTMLGALYVGGLFPFVLRLRLLNPDLVRLPAEAPGWLWWPGEGGWLLLYVVLVTSSVDVGAFFIGRAIGGPKLAPRVSPGKTWAGAIGGTVTAVGMGYLIGLPLGLTPGFILLTALVMSISGQFGDLAKSAMKRELNIKDFGAIMPGHGGVLDRFDSLLFSAPVIYWLLQPL